MATDFLTITVASLDLVTGGAGNPPAPPPPPKPSGDDTGKYCKDGMDQHWEGTAKGGVQTPVGLKLEGEASVSYTKCK